MGVEDVVETDDNHIKVFPSALIQGKVISPVRIRVIASSNENAKPKALKEASLFCALNTLSGFHFCQMANLNWSKKNPRTDFIDSERDFDINRLYPSRQKPPILFDNLVPERIKLVWSLYQNLSEYDKGVFLPALFAYYSAKSITHKYSTLAMVAYVAALSSLSKERKNMCSGKISCSEHGDLEIKHQIVGDKAAIIEMIKELNSPLSEGDKDLKNLIDRVYYKQRSSYVHGAELRHAEFYQGFDLPSCFPTDKYIVRDEFYYKNDSMTIEVITRRILLQWLFKKNNKPVDTITFNLDNSLVTKHHSFEASYVVPNVWIKPFHDGQKEESKQTN